MPITDVLCIAFGTRGDVLPLLALLNGLKDCCRVHFITHHSHQSWIKAVLPHGFAPTLLWTSSKPYIGERASEQLVQRSETKKFALEWAQNKLPGAAILYNTFSLEGFHLAEYLGVHSILVTPVFHHTQAPDRFATAFADEFPVLYHKLQANCGTRFVCWDDVISWMWPVFTDHWEDFRKDLGLCPVPYSDIPGSLPIAPLVLVGQHKMLCNIPQDVLQPNSRIVLSGPWYFRLPDQSDSLLKHMLSLVPEFEIEQVIAVDFGSNFSNLEFGETEALMMLEKVSMALSRSVMLFAADWKCLGTGAQIEMRQVSKRATADNTKPLHLCVVRKFVEYSSLLGRFAAFVHSGGAGTVVTAVEACIPQVVLPSNSFDHEDWARTVERLGLGYRAGRLIDFLAMSRNPENRLMEAFADKVNAAIALPFAQLASMRDALEVPPDGVHSAIDHIIQYCK